MVVALMLQFYREPRIVRITNQPGAWPTYVEFFIEDAGNDDYLMHHRKSVFDESKNQYITGEYSSVGPTKGMMDIKVVAGTAMPWAKTTRANIAFRLADGGYIDGKELLKTLEWPNAEQVTQAAESAKNAAALPPVGGKV
jgi:hypothetical protein